MSEEIKIILTIDLERMKITDWDIIED